MKKIIVLALSTVFLVGVLFVAAPASAVTLQELQNQIQSLLGQVQQLQAQNQGAAVVDAVTGIATDTSESATSNWCFDFKQNLRKGDIGRQVGHLQAALEKEGFTVRKLEKQNNEFGDSTKSAVIGFQEKYKDEVLTPLGRTSGTGFVGNATRAKLNSLYGCKKPKPEPQPGVPFITVISPSSGMIGTKVTLTGVNFTLTNNVIQFGPVAISSLVSPDNALIYPPRSNILTFTVPEDGSPYCPSGEMCPRSFIKIIPGTYPIKVINTNGESNLVNFTVTSTTQPSITVISPNGGERREIGKTNNIQWKTENIKVGWKAVISLIDGPTSGVINGATEAEKSIYSWDTKFIAQGDAIGSIQPGQYKIKITLYDGLPCLGLCSPDYPQPKIIAEDSSDAPFSIIKSGGRNDLMQAQIDAIIALLQSFGVNQSIIDQVMIILAI